VIAGLLLLSGRLPAFALLLLAPIVINILAFHAILEPAGIGLPLLVVALEAYLGYRYFSAFRAVFESPERQSSAAARTASAQ
jgi:hypothetical protein